MPVLAQLAYEYYHGTQGVSIPPSLLCLQVSGNVGHTLFNTNVFSQPSVRRKDLRIFFSGLTFVYM